MNQLKTVLFFILFTNLLYGKCDENSLKLISSYEQIVDCKDNYLIWNDGTKMLYDDGIKKTQYKDLINEADIEDTFYYKYPKGKGSFTPKKLDIDPGRIRNEQFMKKMYGSTKEEVEKSLVKVKWLPKSTNRVIRATKINNIAVKLKKISDEIDNLPDELKKYVTNIDGVFFWRNIRATKRLSVHSFGAAIDLDVKYSAYWKEDKEYQYRNSIPKEVVEIFEKYGFIWGGKWYHYDTMHFEYRPELFK